MNTLYDPVHDSKSPLVIVIEELYEWPFSAIARYDSQLVEGVHGPTPSKTLATVHGFNVPVGKIVPQQEGYQYKYGWELEGG